jgi:hypothetical protein
MTPTEEQIDKLLGALVVIRGRCCEHSTAGLGSCQRNGRRRDAYYGALRCCAPCIADAAINEFEGQG